MDRETGKSLAPACRVGRAYDTVSYLVFPGALRTYLSQHHLTHGGPPPYASGCQPVGHESPRIIEPVAGQSVQLIPGVDPSRQRVSFSASSQDANGELSWFVDGALVETAPSDRTVLWSPVVGDHEVIVVDAMGRSARVMLRVSDGAGTAVSATHLQSSATQAE